MKRLVEMILEEPYRVFFPLGILAGIWGVLMWPLFYGGHLEYYPAEAHARISHHIYAAWSWVAAGLVWLAFVGPFLLRNESGTVRIRRFSRRNQKVQ